MLRPPERLTITETMEKYVRIVSPGAYIGNYRSDFVPYMEQPANTLTSRDHNGVIFVGPAQTGKTEALILGWLAYSVRTDPSDMIIFSPTQSAARRLALRSRL
jgi:phage terminase large subunit GpA-like protein